MGRLRNVSCRFEIPAQRCGSFNSLSGLTARPCIRVEFQTERVSFYPWNTERVLGCALLAWGASSRNYQRGEAPYPLNASGETWRLGSGLRNRHRVTRRLASRGCLKTAYCGSLQEQSARARQVLSETGDLSAPVLRLGTIHQYMKT